MSIEKEYFKQQLKTFATDLEKYITNSKGEWSMKGFIDEKKTIFGLSSDTKLLSKIFEIHIFPAIVHFANTYGFDIEFTEHQNHYPDLTFIQKDNREIKFAVDLKTTYKDSPESTLCNGFTLGSHGEYFINRASTKNIKYPYGSYLGHFILGIIYVRRGERDLYEIQQYHENKLQEIPSVASDFIFFANEKWEIASDKGGSGNTANIGSIKDINSLLTGKGVFHKLGEQWFDDYWMNYGRITIPDQKHPGQMKKISNISEFLSYRGIL